MLTAITAVALTLIAPSLSSGLSLGPVQVEVPPVELAPAPAPAPAAAPQAALPVPAVPAPAPVPAAPAPAVPAPLADAVEPRERRAAASPRRQASTPSSPGGYQPPLHGANPHGQGTVVTLDISPGAERPAPGSTSEPEEVVVGRARGERQADGSYHGHITVVSLFGNEIIGVDTAEGQSAHGPLEALQEGVLDALCDGSGDQICLEVLRADSATSDNASTNSFAVASARLGGADGISADAASSNGNISDDGNCQTAHGDATVARLDAGGNQVADVATSRTDSRACNDGTSSQSSGGRVIGLGGTGVPLPAAGCGDGTPDTVTGIPTVAPIVCNATDSSGTGESAVQAVAPYGVRDALSIFVLDVGGTALLGTTVSGSGARAAAPGTRPDGPDAPRERPTPGAPVGPDGPASPREDPPPADDGPGGPDGPGAPEEGGPGEDGPGAGPAGPTGDGGDAAERRLAFTGWNVLLLALMGALTLAAGLLLARVSGEAGRPGR